MRPTRPGHRRSDRRRTRGRRDTATAPGQGRGQSLISSHAKVQLRSPGRRPHGWRPFLSTSSLRHFAAPPPPLSPWRRSSAGASASPVTWMVHALVQTANAASRPGAATGCAGPSVRATGAGSASHAEASSTTRPTSWGTSTAGTSARCTPTAALTRESRPREATSGGSCAARPLD